MGGPLSVTMTVEQCWHDVPGGSGSYIHELALALADHPDVAVTGLAARHGGDARPVVDPGVPVRHSRLPRTALYEAWNRLRRPRAERTAGSTDVVHATTWAVPGSRAPLVVTVHDLAFLRAQEHFTARGNSYFRRALDVVRAEAAHVVVPSVATQDDCLAHGFDAARLSVVPHGVRSVPVPAATVAAWRARHGVDRPYVLWCGTLEPRKNVGRLVDAFSRARLAGDLDADLVLVGPVGWGDTADRVQTALSALPPGSVRLLGRLDDADLQTAYAGAAAFAFPSLWEGFGMPVLEAMAYGVPVVTSTGTSMAEVVGPHGVLVDPLDVDGLAAGIVAALATTDRAAVREHAETFTWATSASAHLAVYRAVAAGRRA